MTLHTMAIVLRQSVVFSMGRFLFCSKEEATDSALELQPLGLSD